MIDFIKNVFFRVTHGPYLYALSTIGISVTVLESNCPSLYTLSTIGIHFVAANYIVTAVSLDEG